MKEKRLFPLLEELRKKCQENENRIREEYNMTPAEYRGLLCLQRDRLITCREFSNNMGLSPSRGTRVIDNLLRRELIEREEIEDNRRCKSIALTDKGRRIQAHIQAQVEECERRIASHITESKLRTLKDSIQNLMQVMTDM